MISLKQYVKEITPDYIRDNDSYRDNDNKGFVERYLEIFSDELDEFYYPKIDSFSEQFSPKLMNDEFLDYLAYENGDVPNLTSTTEGYRNFLSYIVSIWKIKGTKKSFLAILLPLRVIMTELEEIEPLNYVYDAGFYYDQANLKYDLNCPTCTKYNIKLESILPMTASLYNNIINAIKLVEPLGAVMNTLEFNGDATTLGHIIVEVDENGDLVYNNDADPDLILTLSPDGELQIGGPNAARYFLQDGDLYYVDF